MTTPCYCDTVFHPNGHPVVTPDYMDLPAHEICGNPVCLTCQEEFDWDPPVVVNNLASALLRQIETYRVMAKVYRNNADHNGSEVQRVRGIDYGFIADELDAIVNVWA